MRRAASCILLVALLQTVAASVTATETPEIETVVAIDSVTVGQRFRVRYTATYPESLALVKPETFDTGRSRILSLEWREGDEGGRHVSDAVLTVMNLDLESAVVASQPVIFRTAGGDTIVAHTDEVRIPVRRLAGDQAENRPLKPQWQTPPSYLYWYLAGAALALVALAVWLLRRRKKGVVEEAPVPELPADFVALQALVEIERMGLLENGEFKRYYTMVVDVVRRYLERRYGILAMDETTFEILSDLESRGVQVEGLAPVLEEADLVKFAKYVPDVDDGRRLMETSRQIIARTRPRVAVAAE